GQPPDGGHQPDGGHGDRPLRDAQPIGDRVGDPGHRPQHAGVVGPRRPPARATATTWATISAADRFLVSPAWPVAQNGQAIPQPACDDTHIVTRSGYFISTDSTMAPSCRRHSIFLVG